MPVVVKEVFDLRTTGTHTHPSLSNGKWKMENSLRRQARVHCHSWARVDASGLKIKKLKN